MSFQSGALMMAWIFIALLSLGFGGVVAHLKAASTRPSDSATAIPRMTSVVGLSLPRDHWLIDRMRGSQLLMCVFVTPSCKACHAVVADLESSFLQEDALLAPFMRESLSVVVLSSGGCPGNGFSANFLSYECVSNSDAEWQLMRVGATPAVTLMDPTGKILDAGPITSDYGVAQRLLRVTDNGLNGPRQEEGAMS